jgi:hypothetical protein
MILAVFDTGKFISVLNSASKVLDIQLRIVKKSLNTIINTISATNVKTVEPKRGGCKTKKAILIALSSLLVIAILASALAAYFLLVRPKSENKFENADRFENAGKKFYLKVQN